MGRRRSAGGGEGGREGEKTAEKTRAKAYTRDSLQALSKLGELVNGPYRVVSQPPIVVPARELNAAYGMSAKEVERALHRSYVPTQAALPNDRRQLLERFELVDMARKVVGVGSVGTRAFIVLLQDGTRETRCFCRSGATASVLEDHLPKSRYRQPGERVVRGNDDAGRERHLLG